MKKCSFIGNLEMSFDEELETTNKIDKLLKDLIFKQNYRHFILNCLKGFNSIAHRLLYSYMQKNLKITLSDIFDHVDLSLGNIPFENKQNYIYRSLIDISDLVVFDIGKNCENSVLEAFDYAKSINKEIIILQ